jgi:glutamine amidotransferase
LPQNEYFYFVHSYVVAPDDPALACGKTTHGETFVSAIEKDNVAAVQFHPEKSQRAGLALLERFLSRC